MMIMSLNKYNGKIDNLEPFKGLYNQKSHLIFD